MAWIAAKPVLLSPEAALGWEFWNRYRRQLPLLLLATCLFPICCAWFQLDVAWSRYKESSLWEPDTFQMPPRVHIAIVLITLTAVPLVLQSFASFSYHYLLPIETGRLMRVRWLLGAMAAALQSAVAFGFARTVTRSDWPIVDPTIYAVLVFAVAQWIAVRFRGREFWIAGMSVVGAAAVIGVVVNHFRAPPTLQDPWQEFAPLTPSQLAAVVGSIGVLFRLTLQAAERDRCQTRTIGRHVEAAVPSSATIALRPFRTSFGSLLSWEWRRNGMIYPMAVAAGTFAAYAISCWLFAREYHASRPSLVLQMSRVELLSFCLGAMVVGPYVLIFTTTTGRRVMAGKGTDTWPMTLPLSNRQVGYAAVLRAMLSVTLASVLAGAIAAGFLLGAQAWLRMIGEASEANSLWSTLMKQDVRMSRVGMTTAMLLASAYVLCGVCESAILTGRRSMAGLLHLIQFGLWIVAVVARGMLQNVVIPEWVVGLLLCSLSLAAAGYAWRLRELPWPGLLMCGLVWIGTTALFDSLVQAEHPLAWPSSFVLFGSDSVGTIFLYCSCTMLPIVLPPLAVRWNRSR